MKNAILRPVTVFSETGNEKMAVEIPYDSQDDGLQMLPASEALKYGVDVPPGWIKQRDKYASSADSYFSARVAANGFTIEADSGERSTPSLESVKEQRIAASVGLMPAIVVHDRIPEKAVTQAVNLLPAVTEKVNQPVEIRPKPLPLPKEILSPAKIAVPNNPPPTIVVAAKNEVTPIVQRLMREQRICMLADNELYAFEKKLGYYRKLSARGVELMIMHFYNADILGAQKPAKVLQDAAHLLEMMDPLRVDLGEPSPYIWVFKNVIVNIQTAETAPNDGSLITLYALQCDYHPDAVCPVFDQLIETVSYGCADVKKLLWEVIAYILSPDTSAKHFFLFFGQKDSGKSLLANILTELYGDDSCSSLNTSDLDNQFAVSHLRGKRLNVCMDLANDVLSQRAVGLIKMLTGGDLIHADRKYRDALEFKNEAKLLLGSNYDLTSRTTDDAFKKRMISVPFRFSVPEEAQDHDLLAKIRPEFSGIALKAMTVYRELKARNLIFTELQPSVSATDGSVAEIISDPKLETVICTGFEFTNDMNDFLTSGDAYDHYCQVCGQYCVKAVGRNAFSVVFKRLCMGKDKKRVNGIPENCFFGVKKR